LMEIWGRGATLLTISMAIKETKLWSGVLWRVWRGPRAWCFFEATGVRSNGGSGEAPARCVIAVATARQPVRGPDSVVSSASFGSLSMQDCVCRFRRLHGRIVGGFRVRRGGCRGPRRCPNPTGRAVLWGSVVRLVSMSQSDRPVLSCRWRALMSQSNPPFVCFSFFLLPGYGLPGT